MAYKEFIINILPAQSPHLVIPIAKGFSKRIPDDKSYYHKFIIFGKTDKILYTQIQSELKDSIYLISSYKELLAIIFKLRNNPVMVHGDLIKTILLLVFISNKVNWICWGSNTKTNKSLLSRLAYPIKWIMMHRLSSIITLMEDDMKELVKTYNLKNVKVMPYPRTEEAYYNDLKHFNKPQNLPLRVLVGNSGHNFESYLELLPSLARFRDRIEVHCMFQYPNYEEKKNKLKEFGQKLFGENFHIDDKMMEREPYYDYMASYDIYICHSDVQTGLGAIYNSLFFGKKIYLNGKNLSWCQSLGYVVFDSKTLNAIEFDDFSEDITVNEKLHNRNTLLKFREDKADKWKLYLSNL